MEFYAGHDIDATNTSLQGYLTTTLNELVSIFGEPIRSSWEDKVSVEWIIKFSNGEVATVYDWKRYELGTPGSEESYEYHIGGNSKDVVSLVKEAMTKKATQVLS